MGRVERELRRAYADWIGVSEEASRCLHDAATSLGLDAEERYGYPYDVYSEAIEAAEALGL